eukprot:8197109-Pyramimonas_sp.AAC.1
MPIAESGDARGWRTKLRPQQKACMASFHHSCPSRDICNAVLVPRMTILTMRSINPFVCRR